MFIDYNFLSKWGFIVLLSKSASTIIPVVVAHRRSSFMTASMRRQSNFLS